MIGVIFDKARAQYVLDCLATGKPVAPSTSAGWTRFDMLSLAGACFFGAMSQDPSLQPNDESAVPFERREAIENTLLGDLHAAIDFCGELTMAVCDDEYHENWEPHVEVVIAEDADGQRKLRPIKGYRGE